MTQSAPEAVGDVIPAHHLGAGRSQSVATGACARRIFQTDVPNRLDSLPFGRLYLVITSHWASAGFAARSKRFGALQPNANR